MKITPLSQTLILAGEGRGPGNPDGSSGKSAPAAGSVLQRVTIVASQPDATLVYLRADYAPASGGALGSPVVHGRRPRTYANTGDAAGASASLQPAVPGATRGTALVAQSPDFAPRRDSYGNALSSGGGISAYLPPEAQYAQTQRLLTDSPQAQRIDVHA